jgi:hypothetical protein
VLSRAKSPDSCTLKCTGDNGDIDTGSASSLEKEELRHLGLGFTSGGSDFSFDELCVCVRREEAGLELLSSSLSLGFVSGSSHFSIDEVCACVRRWETGVEFFSAHLCFGFTSGVWDRSVDACEGVRRR